MLAGQSVVRATEPCQIAACNNSSYPYRVLTQSGTNPVGQCYSTFAGALDVYRGLAETGQCGGGTPQACEIAACNNSSYPYRVLYSADQSNPTGQCFESFAYAADVLRGLQETQQCAYPNGTSGHPCEVVACNNSSYPYRVLYTDTQVNPTGQCYSDFDSALGVVRGLRAAGQCK